MDLQLSSLINSLTSVNPLENFNLSNQSQILEEFVQKLTPFQNQKTVNELQNYVGKITEISKQTGINIASLAYPIDYEPNNLTTTVTDLSSAVPEIDFDVSAFQKAINEDRQKAKELISKFVTEAKFLKQSFIKDLKDKPIHPYEQMIQDYLGKNFKPKLIEEMVVEPDLDLFQVLADLTQLSKDLQEKAMKQVQKIAEQALDTSFPGITSEALASAFAVLDGNEFVIDHDMTKRHLEFVENIRAIPVEYVVEHPYEAAKRILSEFKRTNYCFKETVNAHKELSDKQKQTLLVN